MTGSLALWYEGCSPERALQTPDTDGGRQAMPQSVELHFNLWRDLAAAGANFLDVGILFKGVKTIGRDSQQASDGRAAQAGSCHTVAERVRRFSLFIPGEFAERQIVDLSPLMRHGKTLNAVFNDVVNVERWRERSFEIRMIRGTALTFHEITFTEDTSLEVVEMGSGESHDHLGTVVTFRRSLCERFCTPGNHYIRFRFILDRRTRNIFTSDIRPIDWFLLSSFNRTEITEFRLNERRSFPEAIASRASSESFNVEAVHYFLMRDVRFELVEAHAGFRKMRHLEEDLWKHYLRGAPPGQDPGRRLTRALARGAAKRIMIYHWRVEDRANGVDDFIALAKFRSPNPNLAIFAFVIVLLGAAGSGILNVLVGLLKHGKPGVADDERWTDIIINLKAAVILMVVALLVPNLLISMWIAIRWAWYSLKGAVRKLIRSLLR